MNKEIGITNFGRDLNVMKFEFEIAAPTISYFLTPYYYHEMKVKLSLNFSLCVGATIGEFYGITYLEQDSADQIDNFAHSLKVKPK